MYRNLQIINHLKKVVYHVQIEVRESITGYKKKEISLRYSIKNSLVNEEKGENDFYYKDSEDKIDELAKKDQMEIFEILAHRHLEKNAGYGKNPKAFQTPCSYCNQKTLTTLGWGKEGYPDNLERFFCRLCRTSFGWIDIKDDSLELQKEMRSYYIAFKEEEIKKDNQCLKEIIKELEEVTKRLEKNYKFVRIEQRTPI
jgi:hypothetical protein